MSEEGVWILTNAGENRFLGVYSTAEAAMQRYEGEWITIGMDRYQRTIEGLTYQLTWCKILEEENG